jgi:hypothetical protein
MGTIRSAGLALALAVLCLQTGCGGDPVGPAPVVDGGTRGDGGSTGDGGTGTDGGPTLVDDDRDGHPATADCDDQSAAVWQELTAHADTDGDGRGAGALKLVCMGESPPPGYSRTNDDCAPEDGLRWREVAGLYPDGDGDGWTVESAVTACIGEWPVGYRYEASLEADCDDTRSELTRWAVVYADTDGDGVGAGQAERQCTQAPLPGYSRMSSDCAPEEATRWQLLSYFFRDGDADGYTTPGEGAVCSGERLPPGYTAVSRGPDCDDTTATRWARIFAYVDTDGDGFGTGDAVEQCTAGAPEPGYASRGLDCAPDERTRWQWHSYVYRDEDLDGATLPASGQVCGGVALPPGYALLPSGNDCDDTNATVLQSWLLYPDTDGDGVGHGAQESVCGGTQLPAGYASAGTDCAPQESSLWRMLAYQHRDADRDGFTTPSSGEVCSGTALPAGYTPLANGADCDDANATLHEGLSLYPDLDGDGEGAGSAQFQCTDGSVPSLWSRTGWDCAPEDSARWRTWSYSFLDLDGDGHTVRSSGAICASATRPAGYLTQGSGNDCDDANAIVFRWSVLYPDRDGDTVGAPPRTVQCIGQSLPMGYSIYGDDVNDDDPNQRVDVEQDELDELTLEL